MARARPVGVTILAVLAGLAAVVAGVHTLQMLHLFTIFLGPVSFFTFDLMGALLWGVLAAIYLWLVKMLWGVDRQAWQFLVILSILDLTLAVISIIGKSSWQAMLPAIVISGAVLIYCLLPGTKDAFGVA